MTDQLCFFNDGLSFRHVPLGYVPLDGEALFSLMPTTEQLQRVFSNHISQKENFSIKQQITALENSITERIKQEALLMIASGTTGNIISSNPANPFYNMTALQALTNVRSQIAILRSKLR